MARDVSTRRDAPSAWLMRFSPLIREDMSVLEIACGNGRNTRWLASFGARVTAVDINPSEDPVAGVNYLVHDLENSLWPFEPESFDVVVGINYLWRPRFKLLCSVVKPGGLFLYETFTEEQPLLGFGPKNPDHFLKAGELLRMVDPDWRVLAFEDGLTDRGQFYQRVAARRPMPDGCIDTDRLKVCAPR